MRLSLLLSCSLILCCEPPAGISDEPGFRSDDQVIDIHAHIGSFQGYDLSVKTLLNNIDRYGIDKVLVSNIDGANLPGVTKNLDEITANRSTADTVRKYADVMRGLLWTRPGDGGPGPEFEKFLGDSSYRGVFVGMKFHPVMNQFAADSPVLNPYFELCEKYGLAAVFHSEATGNASVQKIIAMAERFSTVPVILYHMGFFGPHGPVIEAVQTALAAGTGNLYVGTAQAEADAVIEAIRKLGSDRVVFGSDATYFCKTHYEHYEPLITRIRNELPANEFEDVVRGNALRIFGLAQN